MAECLVVEIRKKTSNMKKELTQHLAIYAVMGVVGAMLLGPALNWFSTWAVIQSQQRHYVQDPITDFIEIDGVDAHDIVDGDTEQRMRTIGVVHETIQAIGPHEMKCLVNGVVGADGYVEPGTMDIELYTYSWDEPWTYEPRNSQQRGLWTIPIVPEKYQRCPSRQIYWVIAITPIMPNGFVRDQVVITSTVADIEYSEIEEPKLQVEPQSEEPL